MQGPPPPRTPPPPRAISCPSCGASRTLHNPGLAMFVCEYCSSAVYWDDDQVRVAGEKAVLSEGCSRLYRGALGTFHNKRFRVLGRVRYGFAEGFWDEWFLDLDDGSSCWMTEDQHQLAVQQQVQLETLQPFDRYQVGGQISAHGSSFMVQEIGHLTCLGLEGELPKAIEVGESYPYVDATSLEGRYALGIEFDDDPPSAFLGRWLGYNEVKLDDEGEDW